MTYSARAHLAAPEQDGTQGPPRLLPVAGEEARRATTAPRRRDGPEPEPLEGVPPALLVRLARGVARRHAVVWQHRSWRIAVITLMGMAVAVPTVTIPLFEGHPFALLYIYVVFAASYGTVRESVGAVVIGVAAVGLLLPYFPALPVEAAIFMLASVMLVVLVQILRRARATAQQAQRRTEEALHAAVEAVRMRDDVLTAVSHDLKNPLAAIKGQAQVLEQRLERAGEPAVAGLAEGLRNIDTSATRMARLLDELLDVAQVQAGQLVTLRLQPTDLVPLVREIARDYQGSTDRHRICVETDGSPLVGLWDAPRLERVAGNLISNAIKYSPGGGEIVVALRHEAPAWAVLEVRDQGMGIPAADLPRIFEQFARASNVGRTSGTGVGLAVVRQIVDLHGGSIAVQSTQGTGSTFTVRLPLQTRAAVPSAG
jgi:signal transduction histidine kinase